MAATLWRSASCILKLSFSRASVRCTSRPPSKNDYIHQGKVPSDDCELPDSTGHSVGLDHMEHLAREAGYDDPFYLDVVKRAKGTFEEPTIVKSVNKHRIVGCLCEEDSMTINYLYLYKGEPKRCECGFWFKLVDAASVGHAY